MNSKRCYRDNFPNDYIIEELNKNKDKQFDGRVVEELLKLIEAGTIEF